MDDSLGKTKIIQIRVTASVKERWLKLCKLHGRTQTGEFDYIVEKELKEHGL